MIGSVRAIIYIATLTFTLAGCQSAPGPLLISPNPVTDGLNPEVAQLTIQDQRTHAYIYRVQKSADKAYFAPPRQPLKDTISTALQPLIGNQTATSPLIWTISIEQALIEGQLGTVNYQLEHHLLLRVEAEYKNQRYTNSYRGRLQSKGLATPDEAVLEREFSRLLHAVLNDIAADPKLRLNNQEHSL